MRSVSKQGHLQPNCHSKARSRADNCKMVYLVFISLKKFIDDLRKPFGLQFCTLLLIDIACNTVFNSLMINVLICLHSIRLFFRFSTIVLIALFSQYLTNVKIPVPAYSGERGGLYVGRFPLFRIFPVSIKHHWLVCLLMSSETLAYKRQWELFLGSFLSKKERLPVFTWYFSTFFCIQKRNSFGSRYFTGALAV